MSILMPYLLTLALLFWSLLLGMVIRDYRRERQTHSN